MVDKPIDPTRSSGPTPGAQGPEAPPKPPSFKGGQWDAQPMTFLGMHLDAKEAKQLWNSIIQNLSNAIKKDQERAVKALKKLRSDNPNEDS